MKKTVNALLITALTIAITAVFITAASCFSYADMKPVTGEAYQEKDMAKLYKGKKLILPSSMAGVTVKDLGDGKGILLSGTVGDLTSGKIEIAGDFAFNEGKVGRISVDGLSDRTIDTDIKVYLDGDAKESASFKLNYQMGKTPWANDGNKTSYVYDKGIQGKHKVSLAISIAGEKATKKTSVLIRSVEFARNTLPVMIFDIDESKGSVSAMNGSQDHSVECYGSASIKVPEGYKSEFSSGVEKDTKKMKLEYIRGRGNSTWMNDKKPYKVKFDKKQDLFGMGANKHWVLLAERFDNSAMRNRLTYWLGRKLGMEFTPECVPVEVIMNGDYYGTYTLCEQIRVGDTRVAIDDLEDTPDASKTPEITGGYLLSMEVDDTDANYNAFSTKRGNSFYIENPGFDDYKNDTQKNYIKDYIQWLENILYRKHLKSKTGVKYSDLLDLDSTVDYWWIQEFAKNGDAYGSGSTYLYKKRNGKLFWGPLWDFDYVAWGDLEYDELYTDEFDYTFMPWYERLRRSKSFNKKRLARWNDIKALLQEAVKAGGQLDKYYEETKVASQYNFSRWGRYDEVFSEEDIVTEEDMTAKLPDSYKGEVDQLRDWIKGRMEWVDDNLSDLDMKKHTVKFKAKGRKTKVRKVWSGDNIGKLPKAPKKKGYIFKGWKSRSYGYLASGDAVTEDMTLRPKYVKKSKAKKVEKIYFGNYNVHLTEDDEGVTYASSYTLSPRGAADTVKWSSSNTKIATVSHDGTVTMKRPGKVKITAKAGKAKRSYKITCLGDSDVSFEEPSRIKARRKKLTIKKGRSKQFVVYTAPKPCTDGYFEFVSMNPKIASVDENGVVTAKRKGVTYVMAMEHTTDMYKKCKVVVK